MPTLSVPKYRSGEVARTVLTVEDGDAGDGVPHLMRAVYDPKGRSRRWFVRGACISRASDTSVSYAVVNAAAEGSLTQSERLLGSGEIPCDGAVFESGIDISRDQLPVTIDLDSGEEPVLKAYAQIVPSKD